MIYGSAEKPQITQISQIFLSGFLCASAPLRWFIAGTELF
jgi:hypothetical protein